MKRAVRHIVTAQQIVNGIRVPASVSKLERVPVMGWQEREKALQAFEIQLPIGRKLKQDGPKLTA
jgi:hypothetical protein